MRANRTMLLAAAVAALVVPSGFCNGGAEKGEAAKKITMLHFSSPTQSDANGVAFAASMKAYREAHPEVTVEDEFIQHDNYEVKLKTMVATKELPDVYYSKPDLFPVLRDSSLIRSIDDILAADKAFSSIFKDGAFSDFTSGGKIWGIPFQLQSNHVIYYNKAIFKKAGYDSFPATMDEFVEACGKIRAAGYIPIAMGNKGKWLMPSCIFNTMVYRYTDQSWFDSIFNKKGASFTDEPFVDAAKLTTKLVSIGAFNDDMNSIDNNQQRTLFYNGEAAMFIEGSWGLGPVIENASSELKAQVGLAVLPPVKGKEKLANLVAGGAGWAVCVNPTTVTADRQDLVFGFVKEFYGQKYGDAAAMAGGFPAVKPKIDMSKLDPLQKAYNSLPLQFGPIFDVQLPSSIVDVFYNDLQELLIGTITPEEYASRVQAVNK